MGKYITQYIIQMYWNGAVLLSTIMKPSRLSKTHIL